MNTFASIFHFINLDTDQLLQENESGNHQPDPHGDHQVQHHGDDGHHPHHQKVLERGLFSYQAQTVGVEHGYGGNDQYGGQHTHGNPPGSRPQSHQNEQQDKAVENPRNPGSAAILNVDDGSHCGASTWHAAENGADRIADALAKKFAVGLMLGFGAYVRHKGCQEGVNGTQDAQSQCRCNKYRRILKEKIQDIPKRNGKKIKGDGESCGDGADDKGI